MAHCGYARVRRRGSPWIWTLLPLTEGYAADVETFGTWDGSLRTVHFTVVRTAVLVRDGQPRECWVVASDRLERYGIHGEAWVEKSSRRMLQERAWTDNGTEYFTEVR